MKIHQSPRLKNHAKLTHAFTSRSGGVSLAPFNSLNLAFHVGDFQESVLKNHLILATHLNYKRETLVHMKQIHSNLVHIVDERDDFLNPPTCDALITNKTDIPLMVMVADCSPVLFYDDKKRVIAVAHAGREGTFKNIVKNVIESFVDDFGSDARDILLLLGQVLEFVVMKLELRLKQVQMSWVLIMQSSKEVILSF